MPKFSAKKMPKIAKEYLRDLFKQNKINSVDITFSGEGDDGSINGVFFYPESIEDVKDDVVSVPSEIIKALSSKNMLHDNKDYTSYSIEDIVVKFLEHWIYNEVPVDWVNGDGGEGCCTLELKKDKFTIKVSACEFVRETGPKYVCEI